MGENSKIEWTDHTWTPVVGCDPISPACAFCYAALLAARLEAMGIEKYVGLATRHGNLGKWTGDVHISEPDMLAPLKVKKPARWFLTSMGDIFHKKVPFEVIDRLFAVMALTPHHTYYVLSKRLETAATYLLDGKALYERVLHASGPIRSKHPKLFGVPIDTFTDGRWHPNIIIGGTVEDQECADERRPHMERIAAAGWHTFVSYEPALGPVDWSGWEFLSWLISGGESGQHARPSHPDWHRNARDFSEAANIPYLFKQWGEWAPHWGTPYLDEARGNDAPSVAWPDGTIAWGTREEHGGPGVSLHRPGKKIASRLLDGIEHNGLPLARGKHRITDDQQPVRWTR